MMPDITFHIQTGYHPERMPGVLQNIVDTANNPDALEVLISVHENDPASHHFDHARLNIKTLVFPEEYNPPDRGDFVLQQSTGRIMMGMNDDWIIHTKGWDDEIKKIYASFPDEIVLVGFNDLMFGESLFTFPFRSRRAMELIRDQIVPYQYYRADDDVHHTYDILRRLGHDRIVYRDDIIFEHNHYKIVNGKRVYAKAGVPVESNDGLFYFLLEGQRKVNALKLAMAIDPSRAAEYNERLFSINDRLTYFKRVDK
jgi:hypothetical protein